MYSGGGIEQTFCVRAFLASIWGGGFDCSQGMYMYDVCNLLPVTSREQDPTSTPFVECVYSCRLRTAAP